jgi:hypothetical protein
MTPSGGQSVAALLRVFLALFPLLLWEGGACCSTCVAVFHLKFSKNANWLEVLTLTQTKYAFFSATKDS